jgi:hypothetical protein
MYVWCAAASIETDALPEVPYAAPVTGSVFPEAAS